MLSIVDELESPFMNIRYTHEYPATDPPPLPKARKVLQPTNTNVRIPKDYTPFCVPPSPDHDPYSLLKFSDEMTGFYHDTLAHRFPQQLTKQELRHKVELIREKHHQVCSTMWCGVSEFNFLFRDFIGHLTMIIEKSRCYNWTIEFLMPFLQNARDTANSIQAFSEAAFLIKQLSEHQTQEAMLAHSMTTIVWSALLAVFQKPVHVLRDRAGDTLKTISQTAPLTISSKIVKLRGPAFFHSEMAYFRDLRTQLLGIIYNRLLTEPLPDAVRRELLQEVVTEAHETFHREPNSEISRRLGETFNIQILRKQQQRKPSRPLPPIDKLSKAPAAARINYAKVNKRKWLPSQTFYNRYRNLRQQAEEKLEYYTSPLRRKW